MLISCLTAIPHSRLLREQRARREAAQQEDHHSDNENADGYDNSQNTIPGRVIKTTDLFLKFFKNIQKI